MNDEKKPKKKKVTVIMLIALLIFGGSASILIINYILPILYFDQPSASFQQCILDNQLTIFTSPTCSHCVTMRDRLVVYNGIFWIDCSESLELCTANGVDFVPAYGVVRNGTMKIVLSGELSVDYLEQEICGG